ncbi:hypothetical protein C1645_819202 [Glomus cerebriforme]|uniref:Uncharacterized protein n=1 Tax=Glomus cerebriforme TaxID=658196 RepID=A0A397TBD3_9GLOM|nr:hypothetical protein C1645_819202 [Glomus cerebriforme]
MSQLVIVIQMCSKELEEEEGLSESQSFLPSVSSHKIINHSLYYEPMDNYIIQSLFKEDLKKFQMLLLRLSVSYGWALFWTNKPEAKELFEFLNSFLKLPDRHVLGKTILLASEENPYIWKAVDISSELTDSASAYAAAR